MRLKFLSVSSLRLKIILSGLAVFAVAGASMLLAVDFVLQSASDQETQRAVSINQALLSSALTPLVAVADVGALQELATDLVQRSNLAWVSVQDEQGIRLAEAGSPSLSSVSVHEIPLVLAEHTYGRARFGIDHGAFDLASKKALARLVAVIVALLAVGAITQVLIASRITRRLVVLRDAAQAVAQGQWQTQVDTAGTDEIADVAKAFSLMGAAIALRMEAVLEAQSRLQRVVESLSEGVLFHDAAGNLLECNDAATQLLGLDRTQMQRQSAPPAGWKMVHPNGAEVTRDDLPNHRALAQRAMVVRQIMKLALPDGTERWLSANATPLSQPGQDALYGAVTSLTDVTDHVLAQERARHSQMELERKVAQRTQHLQDALARLQLLQVELVEAQKLASLGSMVAGISHELNTPIGVAVTCASSLRDLMAHTSKMVASGAVSRSSMQHSITTAQEMADLVLKSAEKAAALITSFKRVAVDDVSEQRRSFELAGLVDDLLLTLKHILKECRWSLETDVEPGLVFDSFPGPLDQVLTNLIQNAQSHAFGSHSQGRLRIEARRVRESAEIVLRDDGVGMPADVVQRVFEPFFTTRLGQGGSGLGLSIVRTLVTKKLGGTIRVDSEPGVGTTFTLLIPLVAPQFEASMSADAGGGSDIPLNQPESP